MSEFLPGAVTLASFPDEAVAVIAVGGALFVAVIWVLAATIDSLFKTRAREQTRREIAAYVAEGSMSPEDAARILEAGRKAPERRGCGGAC